MSVTWGTAKGSGTKFRVGLEVTVPSVNAFTVNVTVTTKIWVWTKDKVSDTSVTLSWSGNTIDPAGSENITVSTPSNSDWSTSNKKLVKTATKVIDITGATQSLTVTASITGINAAGATTVASFTKTASIPPFTYQPPAAPTGCAVVRAGGNNNLITWANTNPTDVKHPYHGVEVWRYDNVRDGWYYIATVGRVVSFTDYSGEADRRYSYAVRANNNSGASGFSYAGFVETPPAPPFNLIAARPAVSCELTWTNVSTIAVLLEIHHAVDGVWNPIPIATLAATDTSYTDAAADTQAAHNYAIRAISDMGVVGDYAWSPTVPKPVQPLPPVVLGPVGALDASKPVYLRWSHTPADGTSQTGYKLRWREQGTLDWTVTSGAQLGGTGTAVANEILCSNHRVNVGDSVILAGSLPSPLAEGVPYYAIPSSIDRFAVAASETDAFNGVVIDLSTDGGYFTVTTGRVAGNNTIHALSGLAPGKEWEWTVRTLGRYSGVNPYSPWARVGGFRTASKPIPTVTFPDEGATTSAPKAMLSWLFYDADEGIVQGWAHVSLWRNGKMLEVMESDGEWFDYTFNYDLINGADYSIQLIVEGTNGIRSDTITTNFTAEYVGPLAPGIELTWNADEGIIVLDIENPVDNDAPPAIENAVYRSVDGEDFTLIAEHLPTDTTLIDYLPTPNTINTYRVKATSADGVNEIHDVAVQCDNAGDWYWLNGGPYFDKQAKVRYDAGVSVTFGIDKVLQQFAGRTRPVEFSGPIRNHKIDLTAVLPRDAEGYATAATLMELANTPGPVFYRDPVGRRLLCSLGDIELSDSGNLIEFRTTLTEVTS